LSSASSGRSELTPAALKPQPRAQAVAIVFNHCSVGISVVDPEKFLSGSLSEFQIHSGSY
jgi:hypothetical protein